MLACRENAAQMIPMNRFVNMIEIRTTHDKLKMALEMLPVADTISAMFSPHVSFTRI